MRAYACGGYTERESVQTDHELTSQMAEILASSTFLSGLFFKSFTIWIWVFSPSSCNLVNPPHDEYSPGIEFAGS